MGIENRTDAAPSASRCYASVQEFLDDRIPDMAEDFRQFSQLRDLVDAATDALAHVAELRDAWARGVLEERDGKGGTRSNRNVDVETKLRRSLAAIGIDRRESLPPA